MTSPTAARTPGLQTTPRAAAAATGVSDPVHAPPYPSRRRPSPYTARRGPRDLVAAADGPRAPLNCLQRLRSTGAAATASRAVPRPLRTAPAPPFAPIPHGPTRDLRPRQKRVKIEKETTQHHDSRKLPHATRRRHAATAPAAAGASASPSAFPFILVEDHDRVVRRAGRGPAWLGPHVEEEARDPGAQGPDARVEELDVPP